MGHVKVSALYEGEEVVGAPYSEKSLEVRAIHDKFHNLNRKYGIYRLKDIPTQGDDFVIEFDVENLGDSIDWDQIGYPDERTHELVKAFVERHPLAEQLDKVLTDMANVTFETRYELPRLGQKAIEIIDKVTDNQYIAYSPGRKQEAFSAIHHTLDKEVKMLTSMKHKDSRKSKDSMLSDAYKHLRSDITSFKSLMFWVKDFED
jgi:hypothetical protein